MPLDKILKSHRDQKVRPYATKALECGYGLLEIDVQITISGELCLGHDWRPPVKCFYDCTLRDYLERVKKFNSNKNLCIQFDIKESGTTTLREKEYMAYKFARELNNYRGLFTILVSGSKPSEAATANVVFSKLSANGFNVVSFEVFNEDKEIITNDLWDTKKKTLLWG